jgi:hypothetical protein
MDLMEFVDQTDSCWFWKRGHNTHGRPYWRNKLVYRLLYVHFRGEIPEGLVLDHVVCDNPRCVNPWHVEPRTQRENLIRSGCLKTNLGWYHSNPNLGHHLGSWLGKTDRERNALGQFTGG